nr:tetratricopeptide repeat protein [Planctomycetota bacterium]
MSEFDGDGPEDKLLQEAEELMRQKRFQDAASRYRNLRQYSPTDLWASLGYASALELAGKVSEAEQILEEAALSHHRSAPLHRFRRLFFERREDPGEAATSVAALHAAALEEGPEDQLADLYFNQGRYHEALAELERLVRDGELGENELRASVLARIGACLRQNSDFDGARLRLEEAIDLDSTNHWILSELAEVERALGDIPAARRRYQEALEANPEDHWCRGHLAQMECEDSNIDRGVELYREILVAMPKAAWAKVELAQVLTERDPGESAKLCAAALDDDPTYPWAHAQLGNLARRAGDLDQAREHYRQALSGSSSAAWILHELADICRHLGRMQEAYTHLEHARGTDPYDATTYGYFADLLRHEGKHGSSMANLEKAVELDGAYT